jgi:hypothetical protein
VGHVLTAPPLIGAAAALLLSLAACGQRSPEREEVSAAIAQAVDNRTGDTLDLAQVTSFAWTRVCVIPPYTPVESMDAVVGFRWRGAPIDLHEVYHLLLFIDGDRAVAHVRYPRRPADFQTNGVKCYDRPHARFRIAADPTGERQALIPAHPASNAGDTATPSVPAGADTASHDGQESSE